MDATKGSNPILSEGATLVISGSIYRIPRIGWKDMFRISRFVQELSRTGAIQSSLLDHQAFNPDAENSSDFFVNLVSGILSSEDKLYEFISPFVLRRIQSSDDSGKEAWAPVSIEDLQDPDKFPVDSFPQLLLALGQHPDVIAFFKRWVDLQAALLTASTDMVECLKAMKG